MGLKCLSTIPQYIRPVKGKFLSRPKIPRKCFRPARICWGVRLFWRGGVTVKEHGPGRPQGEEKGDVDDLIFSAPATPTPSQR